MDRNVTLKKLCWSLAELSQSTGLSIGLLRKEISQGCLRARRIGRRLIVTEQDWERFVSGPPSAAKDKTNSQRENREGKNAAY
jgi:hypothetical protein